MNNYLTGVDFILILLYLLLLIAIGYRFSRKLPLAIQGYFVKGLLLKLACGLGFAWVYVYYYGGGDTQMYFRGASAFYKAFFSEGRRFVALWDNYLLLGGSEATLFTKRFTAVINLFSFNSFWACTLLFAALSFIGLWLLFLSFYRLYPKLHKPLAIVTLFIPGVVFWSSGIMKDSLCMLFVGIIVYAVQNVFLINKQKILSIVLLLSGFYVLVYLKAYIAIAMLLAIAFYALLSLKANLKSTTAKVLVMPVATVIMGGIAVLMMNQIGAAFERYSLENLAETAQTYQGYHERISVAGRGGANRTGSGYTLGDMDYSSPSAILAKAPLAINVTFFRPYVWEVSNPVMLLSALESLAILLFTIQVIRKSGFTNFFKNVFAIKEVLFCFSFALVFGFAVGFTSYNFGALVRYKAPCVPFYLIGLVLIHSIAVPKTQNLARKNRLVRRPPMQTPTRIQPS
ncbi:hypothetical protein [Paracnuella aquatica]|uniref:hypothetical protein n=1 Tax=Paracnuella aquatica TaxID=2268757 RepID=UPI000DEFC5F9|nr:hypothetical protein [Paracnuella aquatica]RPD45535.1 hypothetical protein DRJ53_15120 [Paracnuella aquatica]